MKTFGKKVLFCGLLAAILTGCGGPSPEEAMVGFATGVVKHDKDLFFRYFYLDRKERRGIDENPEIAQMMFDKVVDNDTVELAKLILASKLKVTEGTSTKKTIRIFPKDPKKVKEMKAEGCRGFSVKTHKVDGEWKIDFSSLAPIPIS